MNKLATGWGSGFIGMLIFSGSLPATRVAVGAFDPFFLTTARAAIAAAIGIVLLVALKQSPPEKRDIGPLIIVAIGVVVGFPLLTALALQHINASHSTVFIGLLPLSTAIFGVIRGKERPRPIFWLFSVMGSVAVAGFSLSQNGAASLIGDVLMVAAIILCGLGYAEGATLSRRLGGWQVISWALVLSLPVMVPIAFVTQPDTLANTSVGAWLSFGYVSMFSMLIGFVFWYRGLALGGIARVGQLQLLQPFFALIWAAVLLSEPIAMSMIGVTAFVVLCVIGAKRFA